MYQIKTRIHIGLFLITILFVNCQNRSQFVSLSSESTPDVQQNPQGGVQTPQPTVNCTNQEELIENKCYALCLPNQVRHSVTKQCVTQPPACDLRTNDSISGQCLVKCSSSQYRDMVTLQCKASVCANGTSNFPACDDCGSLRHLENGSCVSNTRNCSPQPANTTGGYNQWANGSWGSACVGSVCISSHEAWGGSCVLKCPSGQVRNATTGVCAAIACSNGATNPPACDNCGSGKHIESGVCTANRRACSPQPPNTTGGYEEWLGSSWSSCRGAAAVVYNCEIPLDFSWGPRNSYNRGKCYAYSPGHIQVNAGQTYTLTAARTVVGEGSGSLTVRCNGVTGTFTVENESCDDGTASCPAGSRYDWGNGCTGTIASEFPHNTQMFVYDNSLNPVGAGSAYCKNGVLIKGYQSERCDK